MKSLLLFLVALGLAAEPLPKATPQEAGFSAERLARLDRVMRQSVERHEYAGITVGIARHGKLVHLAAFGHRDLEAKAPMQADTIFRIASMTKLIASTAVMMLYEEGHFQLDDPVSKFIPGFDKVKVLRREDAGQDDVVELEREVTVRHLLTHTSGLINTKAYQSAQVFDHSRTLADMAAKLVTVPLAHQPGAAWRYGQSIDVLGRLVEIWSGKTFDVFLEERLLGPLHMTDTAFYVPSGKLNRLAKSYRLNEQGVVEPSPLQAGADPSRKPTYFSGGGGLYSTAGDYLRFLQMLVNGGALDGTRYLGKPTVEYMMLNHVPRGSVMPPDGPNGRKGYGFGLGAAVLVDPAAAEVTSFAGEFNWGGALGTYFWIDPKHELAAVYMVQRPPYVAPPARRFKLMVYQAMEN